MKKNLLYSIVILLMYQTSAQTEKNNWLFEVGSSPAGVDLVKQGAATGFNLFSSDGSTIFSIGAETGYFVADNGAIKLGLGYTDLDGSTIFSYKIGYKYYVRGKVPFQLDFTGADSDDFFNESPRWLGIQGGYAAFITNSVAFEPVVRYNISLNEDFSDSDIFEFRFNFVIFF